MKSQYSSVSNWYPPRRKPYTALQPGAVRLQCGGLASVTPQLQQHDQNAMAQICQDSKSECFCVLPYLETLVGLCKQRPPDSFALVSWHAKSLMHELKYVLPAGQTLSPPLMVLCCHAKADKALRMATHLTWSSYPFSMGYKVPSRSNNNV